MSKEIRLSPVTSYRLQLQKILEVLEFAEEVEKTRTENEELKKSLEYLQKEYRILNKNYKDDMNEIQRKIGWIYRKLSESEFDTDSTILNEEEKILPRLKELAGKYEIFQPEYSSDENDDYERY